MNILSVDSISKSFSDKILFRDVTFGISQGEKIALIGINGTGKSTLLKILTHQISPDTGTVSFRKGTQVAFLSQNPDFKAENTIWETLFETQNEMVRAIKSYEQVMQNPVAYPEKLEHVTQKMDDLDAWDYENKIREILDQLNLKDINKKIEMLSGGQKKRVALAKILLENPDFVIMDEPTNHLDLEIIEWLEEEFASKNQTLLVVTHDRYFLDKVCHTILEIDNQQIYRYEGNYSYFIEKQALRTQNEETEVLKARNLMRKELEWIRRQPKARGTKAKYRVEAFHDLKNTASKNLRKDRMEINLGSRRQGKKILEIHGISKRFGDFIALDNFKYIFKKYDRIGIIGRNGVGKSTFLNLIIGILEPDSGEIIKGQNTHIGYYTQETLKFNLDDRVIDVVREFAEIVTTEDGCQITASQLLNKFLFPPDLQYSYVRKLSGGQKRRLQLLTVLIQNPNFLILDEPTNDLDIMTLNILEDFLADFSGCLLIVSHDRYFTDRLTDHTFIFEGNGKVRDFNGNYTNYRIEQEEKKSRKNTPNQPPKPQKNKSHKKDKLSYKEQKEFENLETEIEHLENQKCELTTLLHSGEEDHQKLTKWAHEIEQLIQKIEEKEKRWFELSEIVGN